MTFLAEHVPDIVSRVEPIQAPLLQCTQIPALPPPPHPSHPLTPAKLRLSSSIILPYFLKCVQNREETVCFSIFNNGVSVS